MKKWNNALLAIVVVETLVLAARFGPSTPRVYADIPDAGAQRLDIVNELKSSNEKLDKILSLLSDGKLKVNVAVPETPKPTE